MARTKTENTPLAGDSIHPEAEQVLLQSQNTLAVLQAAHSEGRDLANQLLGQAQAMDAIKQISQTIGVSKLAYVKEHKLYKDLAGQRTPNGLVLSGTWEEYCGLLGFSDEKVNQDIANLKAFGEEALECMSSMGIGLRDLRQYRRLPEDEKTALIEAAKTGDKDVFLDLAEEIIAKNAKKEDQLTLQLDEAKAELEAKDEVAASNQKRINQLQEKAALLKKLPPDQKAKELCSEIAAQQTGIDQEIRTNFYNALQKLVDHGDGDHQAFINAQIQMLADAVELLRNEFGGTGMAWENA